VDEHVRSGLEESDELAGLYMDVHMRRAVIAALRSRLIDVLVEDLELIASGISHDEWWGRIEYLPLR
jgi:hypothetical protein